MKTTLLGLLAAVAFTAKAVLQEGRALDDWKTWLVPIALAALGYFSKDATTKP